jgi:2-polyprenyl-6-hydroxyphenyl methylase / 3-demethylubiquinone-9 3-methyltransferase
MSEEFARLGCRVTGVDPSGDSIMAAHRHATRSGLQIDYREAFAEELPFADASFDLACCCDVLEHVRDVNRVLAETARILKPGGLYLFDTVNRTPASWLVYIKIAQESPETAYMPPNLHDWKMFVRPDELRTHFRRHGLVEQEFVGMQADVPLEEIVGRLKQLKRGEINFRGYAQEMRMVRTKDLSCSYLGYAQKRPTPSRETLQSFESVRNAIE